MLPVLSSCGGGGFSSGGGGGNGDLLIKVSYPQDNTDASDTHSRSFPNVPFSSSTSTQTAPLLRGITISYYTVDLFESQVDENGEYVPVIPTTRINYPETTAHIDNVTVGERVLVIYGYDENDRAVLWYEHTVVIAAGINRLNNITLGVLPEICGAVTGTVTDTSGAPIANVQVNIDKTSVTTGADGKYSIHDIPEGQVTISAEKAGFSAFSDTITITAEQTLTYNITLSPISQKTGSVTGTVTDSSGIPLADVTVAINDFSTTTGDNGVFTITGVPEGPATISAIKTGFVNFDDTVTVQSRLQRERQSPIISRWRRSLQPAGLLPVR